MNKLLTGEVLHEAFNSTSKWQELPDKIKARYNEVAKDLNEELGICADCGRSPQSGELLEVCGDMVCSTCVNPPLQGRDPDPNVWWLWGLFNDNGEIIGYVELPEGVTPDQYAAQSKEEISTQC